ncbi:MAG: multidrug effflux MFS transporter [Burkholderiaceae bacterium]
MNDHELRIQTLARNRLFPVLLVLLTMLGPLALSSVVPALPAIQQAFQVGTTVSQLVLSLSLFCTAAASLVYGDIADRFGRRPALIGGFVLATVGSLLAAFGPTITMVVIGRAMQSVGAGAAYVLVRVLVTDVYGPKRATGMLGYVTAAMALAPMVGPILGGVLVDSLGWRWIFGVLGLSAGLLLAMILVFLVETRDPGGHDEPAGGSPVLPTPTGWGSLFRRPDFVRYLIIGTTLQGTFFAFVAGAPYLLIQTFGMSATAYGTHYALVPLGFLVGSLTAGRLGGQLGNERTSSLGSIGALIASLSALTWLSVSDTNAWALLVPMAFGAFCAGFALPGTQTGLVNSARDQPGVASGLFSFVQMTSSALVTQAVGMGLERIGPVAVTGTMTTLSLIGVVGFILFTARVRLERTPAL